MKHILLCIFAGTWIQLSAQTQFTVSGTVTGFGQEQLPVAGTLVMLLHGDDTLDAGFTNARGEYRLVYAYAGSNGYKLLFLGPCAYDRPLADVVPFSFPLHGNESVVNRSLLRSRDCQKPDNTVYFLPGDHKTILNFEARRLRQLLDDFPEIHVEFSVLQLPGESARLAKKRMRTFHRLLEDEQIPFDRVTLCPEVYYYADGQNRTPMIGGLIVL